MYTILERVVAAVNEMISQSNFSTYVEAGLQEMLQNRGDINHGKSKWTYYILVWSAWYVSAVHNKK